MVTHAFCEFNKDGIVTCTTLQDVKGKPIMYQPRTVGGSSGEITLSGTLGRGCLKLNANLWMSGNGIGPGGRRYQFRDDDQVVLGVRLK